jgi:hypothetical protein
MASTVNDTTTKASGYAPVNGLKMYYEMEGTGDPLILIYERRSESRPHLAAIAA